MRYQQGFKISFLTKDIQAKMISLFKNFYKKKKKPLQIFTWEKCQRIHHIGKELNEQLHPQIRELLSPHYAIELNKKHFIEKEEKPKNVFEAATVGLSILDVLEIIESDQLPRDTVKKILGFYQDIYQKLELGCIYNHTMKYINDYRQFMETYSTENMETEDGKIGFTGAWITRYYLGIEMVIQFSAAKELGQIIRDTLRNPWEDKQ